VELTREIKLGISRGDYIHVRTACGSGPAKQVEKHALRSNELS